MTAEAISRLCRSIPDIMARVREEEPLIHCLTHAITMNDSANAILAVGASPNMAGHPKEAAEVVAAADSLVVNLGNINDARMEAMKIAGARAHELGIPLLIDAVGVACSTLRLEYAREFIAHNRPGIIKGNSSEIRALCGLASHARGVDAGVADAVDAENFATAAAVFGRYAREQEAVILVTGPVDLVTDGETTLGIANGTPLLGKLTGTGCMAGALAGTWHACAPSFAAAVLGTAVLGIAGEEAARNCPGLGTFHIRLFDVLSNLTGEQVAEKIKIVGI